MTADLKNGVSWIRDLGAKRLLGQSICYLLFFAFVGYFADQPEFEYLDSDEAMIKLAVRHSGELLGECRMRDEAELAKLAPNMRVPMVCPRERSPVRVELALDDTLIFDDSIEPAGLHNDGVSAIYESFIVKAGQVQLSIKVDDNIGIEGFSHVFEDRYSLNPSEILVIDFNNGLNIHYHGQAVRVLER